jgi:hypothetical protein
MGLRGDFKGDKAGLSIGLTKKERTLNFAGAFERFDITTASVPVKETLLIRQTEDGKWTTNTWLPLKVQCSQNWPEMVNCLQTKRQVLTKNETTQHRQGQVQARRAGCSSSPL